MIGHLEDNLAIISEVSNLHLHVSKADRPQEVVCEAHDFDALRLFRNYHIDVATRAARHLLCEFIVFWLFLVPGNLIKPDLI